MMLEAGRRLVLAMALQRASEVIVGLVVVVLSRMMVLGGEQELQRLGLGQKMSEAIVLCLVLTEPLRH